MSRRLLSETVLTAVLLTAAGTSFAASYAVWGGAVDLWFVLFLVLGAVLMAAATWCASLLIRDGFSERYVRIPLMTVTKDAFAKEPPIRGKRPQ